MKAVIPVAGVGTKLRPHTHTQPKPLIPVAGKPILGHIIDNLIDAGIKKHVFIIGYLREKIQEYVETAYAGKIDMEFVVQEPRKGLAHALWTCKEVLADTDDILINLGDTIFDKDTPKIMDQKGSILAVQQVEDPREFGIAVLGSDGYVKKLSEKPDIPTSNLALVGMYKVSEVKLLLEVLDEMMKDGVQEDEEYALTDALMDMVKRGHKFKTHTVENWFDCGRMQTLLLANRILLERSGSHMPGKYPDCVIIPPVFIPDSCEITQSIIGPYVAIAEHAHINNSIISNSILGAYSSLDSIILRKSVIGNDASLRQKSLSINIGDNTEIDFEQ